jgi:hypothetical protein
MNYQVALKAEGNHKSPQALKPSTQSPTVQRLEGSAFTGVPVFLQAKLAVSQPSDPAELEADRVAEQVLRMPEPVPGAGVQRKCASYAAGGPTCPACEGDAVLTVSRRADGESTIEAPGSVSAVLRSPGHALDSSARAFFEPRFGRDLSQVRVHTDAPASQSAQEVQALAYTVGSHMVFRDGHYAPTTTEGKRLLGHELVHTLQQQPSLGRSTDGAPARMQPMQTGFTVSRTVSPGSTNCVPGSHGTPTNPVTELELMEAFASSKAYVTSSSLTTEVAMAHLGTRGPGGRTTQAYLARFGRPPARRGGFHNRLTRRVHDTQDEALDAEMTSLSAR